MNTGEKPRPPVWRFFVSRSCEKIRPVMAPGLQRRSQILANQLEVACLHAAFPQNSNFFTAPHYEGGPQGMIGFSTPPVAKNATKLSQSFDSLAKGVKAPFLAPQIYKL